MRTIERLPAPNSRNPASASVTSLMTFCAWRMSTRPASVNSMRLRARSNSRVPTLSSSRASCWESDGCAKPSCLMRA